MVGNYGHLTLLCQQASTKQLRRNVVKIKSYPLTAGQWMTEKTDKKWVVWHGTQGRTRDTPANGKAGRATSSIDDWNSKPDHVGAPYLVDRDGTIYKTFDDSEWIYHLGLKGTSGKYDKAAVGIEIANELGLSLDGDKLHAFDYNTPNTVYVGRYVSQDWREYHYFADFDEAQIDATIELTLDICNRHNIEPRFYYPSTAFDYPRCFSVATILCHSNCRKDKTDLLLADWVWQKIKAAGITVVS